LLVADAFLHSALSTGVRHLLLFARLVLAAFLYKSFSKSEGICILTLRQF